MHLNLMAPMFPQLDVNIPEGWWKQDAQLDLDFANRRAYNKSTQFRGRPDSILTYSSPSPKLVYGDDGVLGYAPHNLITYSAQFDNAAWSKSSVSLAAGFVPSPDGGTNGKLVIPAALSAQHLLNSPSVAVLSGQTVTHSFYAKAENYRYIQLAWPTGSVSGNPKANFDVLSGALGTVAAGVTASITAVGDGWFRCVATVTFAANTNTTVGMNFISSTTAARAEVWTADGTSGIYLCGAQLNLGPSALTYIPTTTAAVYSLPIDHDPVTHAPLGVLIEEQRTNLLTYSYDLSNAAWVKDEITVTSNAVASPDGTTTADKIIPSVSTVTSHRVRQAYTFTAVSTSYSVYAKAAGYDWIKVRIASLWGNVNLATGEIGFSSGATVSVVDCGNGWWRISLVGTPSAGASFAYVYAMSSDENSIDPTAWTGDGTSGIYAWGAQLEAGAFPTSYIPTVASQVTRVADQVSILTSAFGFNATEGTLLVDAQPTQVSASAYPASLDDGTANEAISIRIVSSRWRLYVLDGGVAQANIDAGSAQAGFMVAAAAAWAANDFAISRNGASALTDGSGTLPTVTKLNVGRISGGDVLNGHMGRLTVWNTSKTDAELQGLTI